MPRQYESSAALCPFYRMESSQEIWCEGWVEGMGVRLQFKQNALKYKEEYCRGDWEKCPIAVMLSIKLG